jgi:uncharacterized damage-inducible protein DinB
MTWTLPTPDPVDGPTTGPDRPMLEAYLRWQRATLLNICAGLTAEQLATRAIASSNLSLLGLIRHLAKVERTWFRQRAAHEPVGAMYDAALGKDADFDDLHPEQAEADYQRLVEECQAADAAAAPLDFEQLVEQREGDPISLRMVYVHMIGEYARHNGHADLLREAIDGTTNR